MQGHGTLRYSSIVKENREIVRSRSKQDDSMKMIADEHRKAVPLSSARCLQDQAEFWQIP